MALFLQHVAKRLIDLGTVKKRPLTSGERKLACSVFGSSLNLDSIQVVAHRAIWKHYAMSPNGHIYFHPQDWRADFSKAPLSVQSWLMHELTHVWQVQQGMAVVRKALLNRNYHYILEQGKQFLQYGIEQQAQMVQDYFVKRATGQECAAYESCIPFLPQSGALKSHP